MEFYTCWNMHMFIILIHQSILSYMHAEQTEIVLKVLLYAGVVVKDPTIIQVAAQQVAQENQNQQR